MSPLPRREFVASALGLGLGAAMLGSARAAPSAGVISGALRDIDPTSDSTVRIAAAIRQGQISSLEAVDACLRRIDRVNPSTRAVVQVDRTGARAAARAADDARARGAQLRPLHGVPFTIKDSFDTRGLITTGGTSGRASFVPDTDATVVARLRKSGAILLGKTNTPELTAGAETDNPVYGRTANPYDPTRTPGGSSGGAAAMVAAGGAPFDIGSDTSGSIRLPCHFCGVAGLKPTSGRVPRTGHIIGAEGILQGLTQPGPIARRVEDLGPLLELIAGLDYADPYVVSMPLRDAASVSLSSLRVAVFTDNGVIAPRPDLVAAVRAAEAALRDAGATVIEARPDGLREAYEASFPLFTADGGAWLRRLLVRAGTDPSTSPLGRRLAAAEAISSGELTALIDRLDEARGRMTRFLERFDALLSPVNVDPAVAHGTTTERIYPGLSYTVPYNVAGWPAGTVRAATSSEGLPIGVQVAAAPWREDVVLALLAAVEARLGGWRAPSPAD